MSGRWHPKFGVGMTSTQKSNFLARLQVGSTIGNALVDLGVSRYSYLRERKDDPSFDEQVRLCSLYPEGVCDAMVFNRVLEGGPDMISAAVAFSRMRNGRRYQNQMMKLKYKEFGLKAAALKHLEDSVKPSSIDLERLTVDELKELDGINNAAKDGGALTADQKIRWFDLLQKASPVANSETTPKMLSSVVMTGGHENGEDA
jgi:hypothetical protein